MSRLWGNVSTDQFVHVVNSSKFEKIQQRIQHYLSITPRRNSEDCFTSELWLESSSSLDTSSNITLHWSALESSSDKENWQSLSFLISTSAASSSLITAFWPAPTFHKKNSCNVLQTSWNNLTNISTFRKSRQTLKKFKRISILNIKHTLSLLSITSLRTTVQYFTPWACYQSLHYVQRYNTSHSELAINHFFQNHPSTSITILMRHVRNVNQSAINC